MTRAACRRKFLRMQTVRSRLHRERRRSRERENKRNLFFIIIINSCITSFFWKKDIRNVTFLNLLKCCISLQIKLKMFCQQWVIPVISLFKITESHTHIHTFLWFDQKAVTSSFVIFFLVSVGVNGCSRLLSLFIFFHLHLLHRQFFSSPHVQSRFALWPASQCKSCWVTACERGIQAQFVLLFISLGKMST